MYINKNDLKVQIQKGAVIGPFNLKLLMLLYSIEEDSSINNKENTTIHSKIFSLLIFYSLLQKTLRVVHEQTT